MDIGEIIKNFAIVMVMLWIVMKLVIVAFWTLCAFVQIHWYMFSNHPILSVVCFGIWYTPGEALITFILFEITLLIAFGIKMDKPGMYKAMGIGALLGFWLAKRNGDNLRLK
ncbi:hypothetical protein [Pseudidiomarina terrestris]|uniref:hypothetical protein n=1 Tax=Pseudidiomarina terrestris TaxID=2820060 RepID=UPI00264F89F9|nr:hypothetical protein [Pseudidiomarina sp. 1ASP75-5]MDN7135349.1 hypothetical protein [Pseudidiomarina sp. 1ASP75-5]